MRQGTQLLVIGLVEPLLADPADGHESGIPKERQVLRHARVAEVEPIHELTHWQFLAPYVAQDLLAAWLRDELESIHLVIIAKS